MDTAALDRWLTTESDNGFTSWVEDVLKLIPETELSADEYYQYEQFFDDGLERIGMMRPTTAPVGGNYVSEQFAADVIMRRYRTIKANPHLKTWAEVQAFINGRGY